MIDRVLYLLEFFLKFTQPEKPKKKRKVKKKKKNKMKENFISDLVLFCKKYTLPKNTNAKWEEKYHWPIIDKNEE